MKTTRWTLWVMLCMVAAGMVAYGLQPLPFGDALNSGPLAGYWTANDGVDEAEFEFLVGGADGNGYLRMTEEDEDPVLSVNFEAGETNVWWRGYAQVRAYVVDDGPTTNDLAGAAAAFYVGATNINLYARDDDEWVSFENPFGGVNPTNNWIGYAVQLDYAEGEWNLYVSTTGFDTALTKVNASPMQFSSEYAGNSQLESFTVKNHTSLDAINLVATTGALNTDAEHSVAMTVRSGTTGSYSAHRVSNSVQEGDKLDDIIAYISAGLGADDEIHFWYDGSWNTYTNGVLKSGLTAAEDLPVTAGMPYWIKFVADIDALSIFDPAWHPASIEAQKRSQTVPLANNAEGRWTVAVFTADVSNKPITDSAVGLPGTLEDDTDIYVVPYGSSSAMRATKVTGVWVPRPHTRPMPTISTSDRVWIRRPDTATDSLDWEID